MSIKLLREADAKGKKVLVRVDLNSTIQDGAVQLTPRMKAHTKTLDYLVEEGAKVIVLAHQGRPGRDDFLHLDQHARILSELLGKDVKFVESVVGDEARNAIKNLNSGEILLLDNVRMHPDELRNVTSEEYARSELVKKLSRWCDLYVNDAFSVSHRNQASITGFPQVMDSCVGPRLEEELDALKKLDNPPEPVHFILGGNKPKDAVGVMEKMLEEEKLDLALLGGVVGEAFLQVSGVDLGAKQHNLGGLKDRIKHLIDNYGDRIVLPMDVAYKEDGKRKEVSVKELPVSEKIFDVGMETVGRFKERMSEGETVVMNGPLGKTEEEIFRAGTEKILRTMKDMDKLTLIGGGDTSELIETLDLDLRGDFSHVSLAGGAFVSYLSGEKLPGIEALR